MPFSLQSALSGIRPPTATIKLEVEGQVTGFAKSPCASPSSCNSENKIQRVHLYLGTPKGGDIFKTDVGSAIANYVHRLASDDESANKNFGNYPLVFATRSGFESFISLRDKMTTGLGDNLPKLSGNLDDDTGNRFLYALKNVKVHCAEDFKFSQEQKIYIIGHGAVGLDQIEIDGETFTMSDIAKKLIDIGVPSDARDFRLTSCNSADARTPPDLKAGNLDDYGKSSAEKITILGFTLSEKLNRAPGEYLAFALSEHGFQRAVVTGYHGKGAYVGSRFPEHSLRSEKHPQDEGYDPDNVVRRSAVGQRFTSDID
ncbi:hypothetical protein [Burkholderia ubonensis]|uniref:hypothetical protein n=1 Tax=Burkholderia ubonensis TaxID=101571 RepID=UPI0012F994EE|nr:hypothetical protein [Burkholderia ubonensis]